MRDELDILRREVAAALDGDEPARAASALAAAHEADVAAVLGLLGDADARWAVFATLGTGEHAAQTLIECREDVADDLLKRLAPDDLTALLEKMSPDDRADLLGRLDRAAVEAQLAELPVEDRGEAADLLRYPEESAGGLMTPDFFWVPTHCTANEAIERLRAAEDVEEIAYIYVLDAAGRLQGVASIRDLLAHPADSTLASFMTTAVHSVAPATDQEEVARQVARYNLVALPVVDADGRMLGVITVDDVIDVMREEATEDMLKLAGTDDEEILSSSALAAARIRFPWLFVSWLGGVMAINIVGGFQSTLSRVVALAAFMPVINGMGGNVGSQSATITVRGLATGRLLGRGIASVVFKELRTGLLLGVGYGLLLAAVAQLLEGSTALSIVVGISICASMVIASLLGSLLPMLFHRFEIDPAVASGPFVTTCLDLVGISVYFLLATALLF